MKGNYKLIGKRSGDKMIVSQQSKIGSRKRMLSPVYETYTYDFDDYDYKGIHCHCSITYTEELNTGKYSDVQVDASIEDPETLAYDVYDNVSGYVDSDNIIRIGGSVTIEYYNPNDFIVYLTVTSYVDGYFDGSDGEISWS